MVRLINFRAEDEIETALLAGQRMGKFKDAQEFLEHLIKNYYAELKFGMAATDIKNEWDQPLTLIDDKTKIVIQGFTGKIGSFHAKEMIDYGSIIKQAKYPRFIISFLRLGSNRAYFNKSKP